MNTHDIELPPLPDLPAYSAEVFDREVKVVSETMVEQLMQDYAREAIEADRKRREAPTAEVWPEPLSEFSEGQWWVKELDTLKDLPGASNDQKRAVAVVHHLLASVDRQRRGEPVAEEALWCLHILGPDDVHPAPSRAYAEVAADLHNTRFRKLSKDSGVMCKAVVAPWPHDAGSHARGLTNFVSNWIAPQPAEPADSNNFIQLVPEHCDRILWKGSYYHLPIQPAEPTVKESLTVPDGWQLVPKEPTQEMFYTCEHIFDHGNSGESPFEFFDRKYKDILEAAPKFGEEE